MGRAIGLETPKVNQATYSYLRDLGWPEHVATTLSRPTPQGATESKRHSLCRIAALYGCRWPTVEFLDSAGLNLPDVAKHLAEVADDEAGTLKPRAPETAKRLELVVIGSRLARRRGGR